MNVNQQIENATAEGFLALYNEQFSSSYSITELADAPDVRCKDKLGNVLNLEITLTEDRPDDIKAMLGRSDHLDFHRHAFGPARGLADEVVDQLKVRITGKIAKRYGPHTALVIRDSSPLDWDWHFISDDIASYYKDKPNPYDKGVWIIDRSKTSIFRML